MVGQNVYTSEEIKFLLQRFIEGKDGSQIAEEYYDAFEKSLTPNQLRYVRNKYGKDPKYNTAMINTNMGGKKRRRADDGTDHQNPSSSPDPKPKKQRKESEPKSQPSRKNSTEAIRSSPSPNKKGSRSSEQAHRAQRAHVQTPIPLQAPMVSYQHLPVSESVMEMAQALISPVPAPVANMASYQQQQHQHQQQPGRIPTDYNQIANLWDNEVQSLGNFAGLGTMYNLPTMQPSPVTPSLNLAASGGQHRPLTNNTTRLVQANFPMASPYQMVPSPQPMNPPAQRIPAQPMPQYMMSTQPLDGMASIGHLSPLSLPLAASPYYTTDPQASPHSDTQSPPCVPLLSAQAAIPFANPDWSSLLPLGLYNMPQQQQQQQRPDVNPSHFQPILQSAPIEAEIIEPTPTLGSSEVVNARNKAAPAEAPPHPPPPPPMVVAPLTTTTDEATLAENTTIAAALNVVSSQEPGPGEAQVECHGLSLTSDFDDDACQPPFLTNDVDAIVDASAAAAAATQSDQIRDMITTLFPHLEHIEGLEELETPDTIDPKLLSDMYTQPAPQRRASSTPSEGGHEAAGDLAKLG